MRAGDAEYGEGVSLLQTITDMATGLAERWNKPRSNVAQLIQRMEQDGWDQEAIETAVRDLTGLSGLPREVQQEAAETIRERMRHAGIDISNEEMAQMMEPSPIATEAANAMGTPSWERLGVIGGNEWRWLTEVLQAEWESARRAIAADLDHIGTLCGGRVREDGRDNVRRECEAIGELGRACALAQRTTQMQRPPTAAELNQWVEEADEKANDLMDQRGNHIRRPATGTLAATARMIDAWLEGKDGDAGASARATFWREVQANLPAG